MATRIEITYEHPPGSDEAGCTRQFDPDWMLESDRGKIRADQVQVNDRLQTTVRNKSKVLAVAQVEV